MAWGAQQSAALSGSVWNAWFADGDLVWRAYSDGTNIKIAKSTDQAATFAAAVTVGAGTDMMLDNPLVRDLVTGRLHLVYGKNNNVSGQPAVLCHRYSDDEGATWSAEHVLDNGVAHGNNRFYRLTMTARNSVLFICYTSDVNGGSFATDGLLFVRSTDGGATWSAANVDLYTTGLVCPLRPDSIGQADGTVHLVWFDPGHADGTDGGDIWYAKSADDGQTWPASPTKLTATSDYGRPMVAASGGVVLIAAMKPFGFGIISDIDLFRSTNNGGSFTGPTTVATHTVKGLTHPYVLMDGQIAAIHWSDVQNPNPTLSAVVISTDFGATWGSVARPLTYTVTGAAAPLLVVTTDMLVAVSANSGSAIWSRNPISSFAFPTLPVLDDFNRANGSAGANYSQLASAFAGLLNVNGNQCESNSTSGAGTGYWNQTAFGADAGIGCTITAQPTTGSDHPRLFLRISNPNSGTMTGYRVSRTYQSGGTDTVQIERITANAPVVLKTINQDFAVNDKIAATIEGYVITVWRDSGSGWAVVDTYDASLDATKYRQAGYIGLQVGAANAGHTQARVDDLIGGALDPAETFPTSGVLDTFTGADGTTPPSAPWTNNLSIAGSTAGGLKILSNQAASTGTGNRDAYRNDATYGPDTESFCTVTTIGAAAGDNVFLFARLNSIGSGSTQGYRLNVGWDAVHSRFGNWFIVRLDNGAQVTLNAPAFGRQVAAGDQIGFQAIGGLLVAWHKPAAGSWDIVGTAVDSTYAGAGRIGLGIGGTTIRVDGFGGGGATSGVPTNTVAPAVTGTQSVGGTLTCTDGTWTDSPTSFAKQWQRDTGGNGAFNDIVGETGDTYLLAAADAGNKVRCVVVATNVVGDSTPVSSNATGLIVSDAPQPSTPVLDAAQGADGGAGANWTTTDAALAALNVNALAFESASTSLAASSVWNPTSFGANQEAHMRLVAQPVNGAFDQLLLRVTTPGAGTTDGYVIQRTYSSGGTDTLEVRRYDNGVLSAALASVAQDFNVGDRIWARITGTLIVVYRNDGTDGWVEVLEYDTVGDAIQYSGSGFIGFRVGVRNAGHTQARVDDFGGGAVTAIPADPSISTLETFTGVDGTSPPNANWTNNTGVLADTAGGIKILSNQAASTGSGNRQSYYNAATFGPDVAIGCTVTTIGVATGDNVILAARLVQIGSGTVDGYGLFVAWDTINSRWGSWNIYRTDNGVRNFLVGNTLEQVAAGDQVALTIIGTRLTAWHKPAAGSWRIVTMVDDATYTAAGNVALGIGGTTIRVDTFQTSALATPTNTAAPTVTGSLSVGSTLTATDGTWTGSPTDFTYQWQRCDAAGANCVDITQQISQTYDVVAADVGHTIRVQVRAVNASGTSGPTPSAAVGPVGADYGPYDIVITFAADVETEWAEPDLVTTAPSGVFAPHRNFAVGVVVTPPSPATGLGPMVVNSALAVILPDPAIYGDYDLEVWPKAPTQPVSTNTEIVRISAKSAATVTVAERQRHGTILRTIKAGDQVQLGILESDLTSIENAVQGILSLTAYGATVTPDGRSRWERLLVSDGQDFTVNAPSVPPATGLSGRITLEIVNQTAGGLGAVSFDTIYRLLAPYAPPAAGLANWIEFGWNGANWVEVGRAAIDY